MKITDLQNHNHNHNHSHNPIGSYPLPKSTFGTHPSIKASMLAEMSGGMTENENTIKVGSFNKKTRFQDQSQDDLPPVPNSQPMTIVTEPSHKNNDQKTKTEGSSLVDLSSLPIMPLVISLLEILLDLIYFICAVAGPTTFESAAGWAIFVSIVGIILTSSLLIIRMTNLKERLPASFPWTVAELIYCGMWTVFYLISATALAAACGRYRMFHNPYHHASAWAAGAFFGFIATLVYGFDSFLRLLAWQQEEREREETHPSPPHPAVPTMVPPPYATDPGRHPTGGFSNP